MSEVRQFFEALRCNLFVDNDIKVLWFQFCVFYRIQIRFLYDFISILANLHNDEFLSLNSPFALIALITHTWLFEFESVERQEAAWLHFRNSKQS